MHDLCFQTTKHPSICMHISIPALSPVLFQLCFFFFSCFQCFVPFCLFFSLQKHIKAPPTCHKYSTQQNLCVFPFQIMNVGLWKLSAPTPSQAGTVGFWEFHKKYTSLARKTFFFHCNMQLKEFFKWERNSTIWPHVKFEQLINTFFFSLLRKVY